MTPEEATKHAKAIDDATARLATFIKDVPSEASIDRHGLLGNLALIRNWADAAIRDRREGQS